MQSSHFRKTCSLTCNTWEICNFEEYPKPVSFTADSLSMLVFEFLMTAVMKKDFLINFRLPEDFGGKRSDITLQVAE